MADTIKWPEVKKTCEKPKIKPEIADTFNWAKEERQKLNESVLVENVRKKLIAKYPEQKCFFESTIIKLMQLGENYEDYIEGQTDLWTDVFLLFSVDWKLLSYLDKDGNTLFDISSFNFDDDFANLLSKKKLNKYFRKNSQWKWELFINWEIFPEWSKRFNTVIANFHIYWKLLWNKSR